LTEKRTMFGHSTTTASSLSLSSHSVWLQANKMTNHMPFSEATTLLKSWVESKAFKHLKTILEITNQALDLGPWIQRISYMKDNPFNTVSRPRLTLLWLILEALSWLCLQSSIMFFKIHGGKISQIWIAKLTQLSAKVLRAAPRLLNLLSLLVSRLEKRYLTWAQLLISTRVRKSVNLLLPRTLSISTTTEISFSVTFSWSIFTQFMTTIKNWSLSVSIFTLNPSSRCTQRVKKDSHSTWVSLSKILLYPQLTALLSNLKSLLVKPLLKV